jgi:hypothetical protein
LEFYNLAADPGEGKNLIDRETTLARSMSVTLRTILAGYPTRPERRVELEPAIRERLRALGYIR